MNETRDSVACTVKVKMCNFLERGNMALEDVHWVVIPAYAQLKELSQAQVILGR